VGRPPKILVVVTMAKKKKQRFGDTVPGGPSTQRIAKARENGPERALGLLRGGKIHEKRRGRVTWQGGDFSVPKGEKIGGGASGGARRTKKTPKRGRQHRKDPPGNHAVRPRGQYTPKKKKGRRLRGWRDPNHGVFKTANSKRAREKIGRRRQAIRTT